MVKHCLLNVLLETRSMKSALLVNFLEVLENLKRMCMHYLNILRYVMNTSLVLRFAMTHLTVRWDQF